MRSQKFSEEQKITATRIIKTLFSSKSRNSQNLMKQNQELITSLIIWELK
jgi:hypothetical protein